jgi:hypothetical protein
LDRITRTTTSFKPMHRREPQRNPRLDREPGGALPAGVVRFARKSPGAPAARYVPTHCRRAHPVTPRASPSPAREGRFPSWGAKGALPAGRQVPWFCLRPSPEPPPRPTPGRSSFLPANVGNRSSNSTTPSQTNPLKIQFPTSRGAAYSGARNSGRRSPAPVLTTSSRKRRASNLFCD